MTMTYTGTVLDAPDARELAGFYRALLNWTIERDDPEWVVLCDPSGTARLSFQTEPAYRRPTWPGQQGSQLMMAHLDIEVDDLAAEVAHAVAIGAVVADFQPQLHVRVCLDPAGHPFCLYVREG